MIHVRYKTGGAEDNEGTREIICADNMRWLAIGKEDRIFIRVE